MEGVMVPSSKHIAAGAGQAAAAYKTLGFVLIAVSAIAIMSMKKLIQPFVDFEKQLNEVSTMLDDSAAYMDQYSRRLLGLSISYGDTTESLSKGLYDILSASIDAAKALDVLTVSAMAGRAGMTDTATAADAITTVLNSYTMSADQAGYAADILFGIVKKGKLVFTDVAGDIGRVASTAATAGVAFEELAAVYSAITRGGIKSSIAVTSLNSIITQFLKPTDDAIDAAKELGIELNTTTLRTLGLGRVIMMLSQSNAELVASIFPNRRALRGMNVAIRQSANLMGDLRYMVGATGASYRAFRKATEGLHFVISQMQQAFKAFIISLGQVLAPTLRIVVTWLRNMAAALYHMNPIMKTLLGYTMALGPIVIGIIGLIMLLKPHIHNLILQLTHLNITVAALSQNWGYLAVIIASTIASIYMYVRGAKAISKAGEEATKESERLNKEFAAGGEVIQRTTEETEKLVEEYKNLKKQEQLTEQESNRLAWVMKNLGEDISFSVEEWTKHGDALRLNIELMEKWIEVENQRSRIKELREDIEKLGEQYDKLSVEFDKVNKQIEKGATGWSGFWGKLSHILKKVGSAFVFFFKLIDGIHSSVDDTLLAMVKFMIKVAEFNLPFLKIFGKVANQWQQDVLNKLRDELLMLEIGKKVREDTIALRKKELAGMTAELGVLEEELAGTMAVGDAEGDNAEAAKKAAEEKEKAREKFLKELEKLPEAIISAEIQALDLLYKEFQKYNLKMVYLTEKGLWTVDKLSDESIDTIKKEAGALVGLLSFAGTSVDVSKKVLDKLVKFKKDEIYTFISLDEWYYRERMAIYNKYIEDEEKAKDTEAKRYLISLKEGKEKLEAELVEDLKSFRLTQEEKVRLYADAMKQISDLEDAPAIREELWDLFATIDEKGVGKYLDMINNLKIGIYNMFEMVPPEIRKSTEEVLNLLSSIQSFEDIGKYIYKVKQGIGGLVNQLSGLSTFGKDALDIGYMTYGHMINSIEEISKLFEERPLSAYWSTVLKHTIDANLDTFMDDLELKLISLRERVASETLKIGAEEVDALLLRLNMIEESSRAWSFEPDIEKHRRSLVKSFKDQRLEIEGILKAVSSYSAEAEFFAKEILYIFDRMQGVDVMDTDSWANFVSDMGIVTKRASQLDDVVQKLSVSEYTIEDLDKMQLTLDSIRATAGGLSKDLDITEEMGANFHELHILLVTFESLRKAIKNIPLDSLSDKSKVAYDSLLGIGDRMREYYEGLAYGADFNIDTFRNLTSEFEILAKEILRYDETLEAEGKSLIDKLSKGLISKLLESSEALEKRMDEFRKDVLDEELKSLDKRVSLNEKVFDIYLNQADRKFDVEKELHANIIGLYLKKLSILIELGKKETEEYVATSEKLKELVEEHNALYMGMHVSVYTYLKSYLKSIKNEADSITNYVGTLVHNTFDAIGDFIRDIAYVNREANDELLKDIKKRANDLRRTYDDDLMDFQKSLSEKKRQLKQDYLSGKTDYYRYHDDLLKIDIDAAQDKADMIVKFDKRAHELEAEAYENRRTMLKSFAEFVKGIYDNLIHATVEVFIDQYKKMLAEWLLGNDLTLRKISGHIVDFVGYVRKYLLGSEGLGVLNKFIGGLFGEIEKTPSTADPGIGILITGWATVGKEEKVASGEAKGFFGILSDNLPIISVLFNKTIAGFSDGMKNSNNIFLNMIGGVTGFIDEMSGGVATFISNILGNFLGLNKDVKDTMKGFLQGTFRAMIFKSVKTIIDENKQQILDFFEPLWKQIKDDFELLKDDIFAIVNTIWNSIKKMFTPILDFVQHAVKEIIKPIVGMAAIVVGIVTKILHETIVSALDPILKWVNTLLTQLLNPFSTFISKLLTDFLNPFKELFTRVFDINDPNSFLGRIAAGIGKVFSPFWEALKGFGSKLYDVFVSPIVDGLNFVITYFSNFVSEWIAGHSIMESATKAWGAANVAIDASVARATEANITANQALGAEKDKLRLMSPGIVAAKQAETTASSVTTGALFGETVAGLFAGAAKLPFPLNIVAIGVVMGLIGVILSMVTQAVASVFHKGGIVGQENGPSLGNKEVLSVLERGEIVIPKDVASNLLDFFGRISKPQTSGPRFQQGGVVGSSSLPVGRIISLNVEKGAVQITANNIADIDEAADRLWDRIKWKMRLQESLQGAL